LPEDGTEAAEILETEEVELKLNITASMVKRVKGTKTNAGMMDCKQALSSAEGNLEKGH